MVTNDIAREMFWKDFKTFKMFEYCKAVQFFSTAVLANYLSIYTDFIQPSSKVI